MLTIIAMITEQMIAIALGIPAMNKTQRITFSIGLCKMKIGIECSPRYAKILPHILLLLISFENTSTAELPESAEMVYSKGFPNCLLAKLA